MKSVTIGNATIWLGDCMIGMSEMSPRQFNLAIVDPPYGLGSKITAGGWSNKYSKAKYSDFDSKGYAWDIAPPNTYFVALKEVSENQIIWGANYFSMEPCRGFVTWDKGPMFSSGQTFAEAEYAWTSFDRNSKICRVSPLMGFLCKGEEERIHSTQKPVGLYRWLLSHYAKAGDSILDTHMGSGSSVIACLDLGFQATAYEVDEGMFHKACERIERSQQQMKLAL